MVGRGGVPLGTCGEGCHYASAKTTHCTPREQLASLETISWLPHGIGMSCIWYKHLIEEIMSGRLREQLVLFQSFWAGSIFLMRTERMIFSYCLVHFLGSLIKIQTESQLKGTGGQGHQIGTVMHLHRWRAP